MVLSFGVSGFLVIFDENMAHEHGTKWFIKSEEWGKWWVRVMPL